MTAAPEPTGPYAGAALPRWVLPAVVLAALTLVWWSLGDHGLYPPDEGRYGTVSADMAEHGLWLEPRLRNEVHVTKPPLTYWLQGLGVLALGRTELAVRWPSAFGSSVVILALAWFVRRTRGPLVAAIAVGTYAVMPLAFVVGRLGSTDALLNAWWFLALCAGYLAVVDLPATGRVHRGWTAAFWCATALVGLTKGPLILAPLLVLSAWLVLAGRPRDALRLQPFIGLPLALAPLAFVAWLYWQANPERTARVWNFEFVQRITGTDGKDDPPWMFVPVLLVGMFPASAMLTVPGLNVPVRAAWRRLRGGDLVALLALAVLLPFVAFSLLAQKQPTYILPLAAPLSILAALTMARWVDGRDADHAPDEVLPDVRITCAIAMAVVAVGAPVLAAIAVLRGQAPAWAPGWTLVWWALVFLPAAIGWLACAAAWRDVPRRGAGLAIAFAGMVAMWLGAGWVEDRAMGAMDARHTAEALRSSGRPVLVCAVRNLGIDFHAGHWLDFVERPTEIAPWLAAHPDGIVVVREDERERFAKLAPETFAVLRVRETIPAFPMTGNALLERADR